MEYTVVVDGDVFEIEVGPGGRAWVNQRPYEVDLRNLDADEPTRSSSEYSLLVDHRSYEIHIADSDNGERWLTVGGRPYRVRLRRGRGDRCPSDDAGRPAGRGDGGHPLEDEGCNGFQGAVGHVEVRAPLPGLLVELRVREDETVEEQEVVAVLESMKMNLEIRAPRDGVVRGLRGRPGRQVAQDEVLVVLGPAGDRDS